MSFKCCFHYFVSNRAFMQNKLIHNGKEQFTMRAIKVMSLEAKETNGEIFQGQTFSKATSFRIKVFLDKFY